MTMHNIHSLWNSGANQPSADDAARIKFELVRRLKMLRLVEIAWLTWTILLLAGVTVMATRTMLFSARFDLSSEWSVIPLLLLPWVCVGFFLRNYRTRRANVIAADESIENAIRAALANNGARQVRSKVIGALLFATALLLPLVIQQLVSVGKVSSREAVSMACFFAAILGGSGVVIVLKFYRSLRPEAARLEALLRDYHSSNT